MKFHALAVGVIVGAMSSIAHAELIERTFDVAASDFEFSSGDPTPTPIDPVELNFTVIFDTSGVLTGTSDGLTINSFTLPDPPYSPKFTFDPVTGFLVIATLPGPSSSCFFAANTYCFAIAFAAGANPEVAGDFFQETASQGVWLAQSITVTAGPIAVVPEPSTWALMLSGFSGLVWLAFRRRAAPAGAA